MHHHFALTQELHNHNVEFLADQEADRALLVRCSTASTLLLGCSALLDMLCVVELESQPICRAV